LPSRHRASTRASTASARAGRRKDAVFLQRKALLVL